MYVTYFLSTSYVYLLPECSFLFCNVLISSYMFLYIPNLVHVGCFNHPLYLHAFAEAAYNYHSKKQNPNPTGQCLILSI